MLAAPLHDFGLPQGWVAEPKWDGFRAFLAVFPEGKVALRSWHGTDMTSAFPEIVAAADRLPTVLLDGELVVGKNGRLAFERLAGRMNSKTSTAARTASETPAHFVAFDLLHWSGIDYASRPYAQRRDALEDLFSIHGLQAPWTLCPMTSLVDVAREWLGWSTVGIEGVVVKNPGQRYLPGERAWRKYRARESTEGVIGAVTGTLENPGTVLLGRFDATGRLRYMGRSNPLPRVQRDELAPLFAPGGEEHPWWGRRFTASWSSRKPLDVTVVAPATVAEVSVDVARDEMGRWRHPVRLLRVRADMEPRDVAAFGEGDEGV